MKVRELRQRLENADDNADICFNVTCSSYSISYWRLNVEAVDSINNRVPLVEFSSDKPKEWQ